jgi:hypothetical protein
MTRPENVSELRERAAEIAEHAVVPVPKESAGRAPISLAAALVKALAQLTTVMKDQTANAGSYSYSYADLAQIVNLTRPVLAECGVVALTPVHAHDGQLACSVVLIHQSGERMDFGPFPFPAGGDAQATGSAVTYMRRYALLAALGMATDDDDDGHAATQSQREQPTVRAVPAAEVKQRLAEALGGDVDAVKRIGREQGWEGKRHIPENELDAVLASLADVSAGAGTGDGPALLGGDGTPADTPTEGEQ